MAIKNPKCLVIDASVMKAAGGENALYPVPQRCRDFLIEILKLGHSVIMSDDIFEEWEKYHLTTKAFRAKSPAWYATMARKGLIRRHIGNTQNDDLRGLIFVVLEANAVEGVRKDMRLIEAALLADKCVSSHDERSRGHLKAAAQKVEEITDVVWTNPAEENENCLIWLREGAISEDHRQLGYRAPED